MQWSGPAIHRALVAALLVTTGVVRPGVATAVEDGRLQWHRQFGSSDSDFAYGVATDVVGDVYLTGGTAGSLGGPNQGWFDAWLAKYDAAGRQIWKRQLGTRDGDAAWGVAADAVGGVYLAGETYDVLARPDQGFSNAWVAKYDTAGTLLWMHDLSSTSYDSVRGVAVDAEGDVYLSGYTDGSLGGPNQGRSDAWLAKYDGAGTLLWTRQLGSASQDYARGVAADPWGNVYLGGYTDGSLGGANQGSYDAWVAKYDSAGTLLWTQQLGGASGDFAHGVATDASGNVYLTGETSGALSGSNQGHSDAWVAKYDSAGTLLWVQQLGSASHDAAESVATDGAGNVYLAGYTTGALGGAKRGSDDGWLAKYDPAGNLLWATQLGTPKSDSAAGLATDLQGNVYIAGYTFGSLCGLNRGDRDAFVAKYSSEP